MSLSAEKISENPKMLKMIQQVSFAINETLKPTSSKIETDTIIAAYALYKVRTSSSPFSASYQSLISGDLDIDQTIAAAIQNAFDETAWVHLSALLPQFSAEVFAGVIFLPQIEAYDTTPSSVIELALAILKIAKQESVAEIGCGTAAFLVSAFDQNPNAQYTGYEINVDRYVAAKVRAELLGENIQILLGDVFSLTNESHDKFDKVFSNYPFGLQLRNLSGGTALLKELEVKYPGISKATSSDWVFNDLICRSMKDTGKAIGIMTNGSTWNSNDMPIRIHFVETGLIEAVISMPKKLFSYTNIPTSLVVFSHGNTGVRLVDATNICHHGRRQNEFSPADIQTIVHALSNDSEFSRFIPLEELQENDYTLNLGRYNASRENIENGVPFGEIIKRITRGAPCTARQLDEMVSHRVTNMQYLMLANIQDGLIDEKLPYLTKIEPKYEKYCLKNDDLILSKNGYPYKVAVASVKEGQQILANGNLYIIEVDRERANPYYLKAFFESEHGVSALKSITVGATLPSIGVEMLKNLIIPLPSLEEQDRIAQKYQATLDEIAVLKLKLENAVNRLYHVFDAESEE